MYYKLFSILLVSLLIWGCGSSDSSRSLSQQFAPSAGPQNSFSVPGQIVLSDLVYSIQLTRQSGSNTAPILRLNSNDKLRLSFDMLQFDSRGIRVSFTHHNPDWSRSNLAQDFFMEGFHRLNLDAGRVSSTQRPAYRNYQYDFPNDDIRFLVSGNFMLRVEDADTGSLLFSVPFFVTENAGDIASSVQSVITARSDYRNAHYPRSRFELPDFVEMPQFNLEFYYVQNQFWGRKIRARELDTSNEGEVLFELRRQEPFNGDYEFMHLSLNNLSLSAPNIMEFEPTRIPPMVVLRDDAQGFAASRGRISGNRFGNPNRSLSAQYADVHFRFDPADEYSEPSSIYLVGDFNNWSLQSNYELDYNSETGRWQANGIIKEGSYAYKYVLIEDNRINDLAMDDSFVRTRQEYHAFVYYRDPDRFYYRLLQTNNFFKES